MAKLGFSRRVKLGGALLSTICLLASTVKAEDPHLGTVKTPEEEARLRQQGPIMGAWAEGRRRVAVIGAGAGGSSTAYHLHKFASEAGIDADISVFERSSYVGGRSTTVNVWNNISEPVELGASIFVEVNHILFNFAKEFGLEMEKPHKNDAPEKLGVWDGKGFVYTQTDSYPWWNIAKLIWKYGWAPIRTQNLSKRSIDKFMQMYKPPYFPFPSLSQVAYDLGLTSFTAATGEELLKANGIGPEFANEIVQASTRVNYAQNLPFIHGLEAMVCMVTDGAMAIKGGNWRIFDGMLKAAGADVRLNTTVKSIRKLPSGAWSLKSSSPSPHTEKTEEFDSVILAGPYQLADLTIHSDTARLPNKIPYVKLHVTLFASKFPLNRLAFNLPPPEEVPSVILTTVQKGQHPKDGPEGVGDAGFFSISKLRTLVNPTTGGKEFLYKVFSAEPPSEEWINLLLAAPIPKPKPPAEGVKPGEEKGKGIGRVSWLVRKEWNSYPYLFPRVTFEELGLDENLWYTSGIEGFISTMETSGLMGMNVAKLVVDGWVVEEGKGKEGTERQEL